MTVEQTKENALEHAVVGMLLYLDQMTDGVGLDINEFVEENREVSELIIEQGVTAEEILQDPRVMQKVLALLNGFIGGLQQCVEG